MKSDEQKKQDELIRQLFNFLCLRYEIFEGENVKQKYLAKKIGYEKSNIGKWKKGTSPIPKAKYGDLARFFDIDPIWFNDFKSLELIFDIPDTSKENDFSLNVINAPYFLSHLGTYDQYRYSKQNKEMKKLSDSISQRISDMVKDLMKLYYLKWQGDQNYDNDPKRLDVIKCIRDKIVDELFIGKYSELFKCENEVYSQTFSNDGNKVYIHDQNMPTIAISGCQDETKIAEFLSNLFTDDELLESMSEEIEAKTIDDLKIRDEKEMIVLGHNMSFLDSDKERLVDLQKFLGCSIFEYDRVYDEILPYVDITKPCKAKILYERYRQLISALAIRSRDVEMFELAKSEETKKNISILKVCFSNKDKTNK